jgi:SP family general alpha glucoside:H+ symporter-like MFS transporter
MSAPTAAAADNEKRVDTLDEGITQHHSNRDLEMDNEKQGYNRAGAIEAENAEHNMGVWEAVKAYPMASFWAFIMSCTIVSHLVTTNK